MKLVVNPRRGDIRNPYNDAISSALRKAMPWYGSIRVGLFRVECWALTSQDMAPPIASYHIGPKLRNWIEEYDREELSEDRLIEIEVDDESRTIEQTIEYPSAPDGGLSGE